ncbi:MAG: MlaD family protein [Bacteroidaceae bacterium]|nr:MlaD family protein [Bacteroidaceae bacterium]
MKISREVKIGTTAVIALVLLFFTIKFLQGVNVFTANDTYYIKFANAKGLAKSSPVYADGYNVGIVSDINYDYDNPENGIIVAISVEQGMRIPHGTVATLDEAMLGGCTLNLLMGNNPKARYSENDTIPSSDNNGLMAKAGEMIPKVEQTLAKLDTLLATLNTLASDPNIQALLVNANKVSENLKTSSEKLNTILERDMPKMTSTFTAAGENVVALTDKINQLDFENTLSRVDATVSNLEQTTVRLNSKDNSLGLLLNDTSAYHNLNRTTIAAASLLEDLQANPKRYVQFSVFGKKK